MVMEKEAEIIVATLFRKLFVLGKIGHSHTSFDNLPKSFPLELRKKVKKIAKNLIRQGFLIAGKHNYGLGVSLNNKKILEIEEIIVKYFPELKERFKLRI